MARVVKEVHEIITDNGPHEVGDRNPADVLGRVIYAIATIVIILLAFRFLLALLGANKGNAFTDFIYTTSQPLVAPFFGMFNFQTPYGVSAFEGETLFAIFVYGIIAWAFVQLTSLMQDDE